MRHTGAGPLVKEGIIDADSIIIDAKSGVTGAGRSPSQELHYCEVEGNMKAYKVSKHRHTSEIEQELSLLAGREIKLSFTPHLIPVKRGILSTIYCAYKGGDIKEAYGSFYKDEPFVNVYESGLPELKHVVGSNFLNIGYVLDKKA
jgi:N-acetyl-gamma-glutamyl-phosphate reductase